MRSAWGVDDGTVSKTMYKPGVFKPITQLARKRSPTRLTQPDAPEAFHRGKEKGLGNDPERKQALKMVGSLDRRAFGAGGRYTRKSNRPYQSPHDLGTKVHSNMLGEAVARLEAKH